MQIASCTRGQRIVSFKLVGINHIIYYFKRRYTILEKIEELRRILHEAIAENKDVSEILRISQELDELIVEYHESMEPPF